jgi:hypothetical protein
VLYLTLLQTEQVAVDLIHAAIHTALLDIEFFSDKVKIFFSVWALPNSFETFVIDIAVLEFVIHQVSTASIHVTVSHDVSPKKRGGIAL